MNNSIARSVTQTNNTNYNFPKVPFSKVKGTCPACGRMRRARDWKCAATEDGSLVLCSYAPSDRTDANGRYIHVFDKGNYKPPPKTAIKPKPRIIASAEKIDRIYREFLNSLILTPQHAENLLERGLSDTAIAYNLYASIPSFTECIDVVKKLREKFPNEDLSGIAGFYTNGNAEWRMSFFSDGFFVPFRNPKGRIVGLQIRLDSPKSNSKYVWFSSSDKSNGTAQTMQMHFASPDLIKRNGKLILTEGALKADICAEMMECATAAIAGTGISEDKAKEYSQMLVREFPELQTVQLAPDADWRENENVCKAFMRLKDAITEADLKAEVISWDADLGKGIDDFLMTQRRLEI